MKKVLVFTDDNAAMIFSVILNFSVASPIEPAIGNVHRLQTVPLKMLC